MRAPTPLSLLIWQLTYEVCNPEVAQPVFPECELSENLQTWTCPLLAWSVVCCCTQGCGRLLGLWTRKCKQEFTWQNDSREVPYKQFPLALSFIFRTYVPLSIPLYWHTFVTVWQQWINNSSTKNGNNMHDTEKQFWNPEVRIHGMSRCNWIGGCGMLVWYENYVAATN